MIYLVTGGGGFIGSNIAKHLLEQGEQVRILDNFSTGKRENVLPLTRMKNFRVYEGDLRSFHLVREAVKGVDFVLHQGALPSVPRSINDPITTNEVNTIGTLNILEASKEFKVQRVVYASSSSIYGNQEASIKTENLPVQPMSPYAVTKYAAERYCQLFYELYKLETVCLRYFNVFGPNQDPSSQYSAVIPKFIQTIYEGEQPEIYGDGTQSRDFTYVANNVEANLLACTARNAPGRVFNIACGRAYNLLTLISEINRILGRDVVPRFRQNRPGDVQHSLADISRAQELMGYSVKVDFITGLEKTVDAFLRYRKSRGNKTTLKPVMNIS